MRRRGERVKMGDMATVYASGSRPQACKYGHPWTPGSDNMILSWVLCECEGARNNPSGYGHHQIRCIAPGCSSVWRDPPHTEDS